MTVESEAGQLAGHSGGAVQLSRFVPQPVGRVWQTLTSSQGTAVWLGEGAVLGEKGQSYHCADGTSGVVRSYHPLEQLRVSWHATDDAPSTMVEVDLEPDGVGTLVSLRHDGLRDPDMGDSLRLRWQERLDALADLTAGSR